MPRPGPRLRTAAIWGPKERGQRTLPRRTLEPEVQPRRHDRSRRSTMFRNREEAAKLLARRFSGRELNDPLVLAIPRGGVVTGAVLARELGAELDVILARKLRAPWQPELAIGAVAEDGEVY